jgi:hypothetical protein
MAVATYEDVAVALGRSISDSTEQEQVEWWLSGAEIIIRGRLGDVGLLAQDVLKYVEVEAVAAKVRRNGTSESSISVAVDDGTVTRRYENAVGADDITDEWWNLLDPDSNTGTASIRPSFESDTAQWAVRTPGSCDDLTLGGWWRTL